MRIYNGIDLEVFKPVSGETQIRVLSEHKPEAGFEEIIPSLEDFYFATLFNQTNKNV